MELEGFQAKMNGGTQRRAALFVVVEPQYQYKYMRKYPCMYSFVLTSTD